MGLGRVRNLDVDVLAHGGVTEGVDDSGTGRERAGFGSRHRSASGGGPLRAEGDVDAFHVGAPAVMFPKLASTRRR
jgi:hypothetical protein